MRTRRFVLASLVLFAVALAWNGLVHLVLLRASDATVRHLWREDPGETMWLALLVTAGMVMVFTWGYVRFVRDSSVREALTYALFFGLVAGLLVDANQFVLYPIPAGVAARWFVAGMAEFCLYALLLRRLFPPGAGSRPDAGARGLLTRGGR